MCQAQLYSVTTPCQYQWNKKRNEIVEIPREKPPRQNWNAWLSLQIAKQLWFLLVSAMSTVRDPGRKEILCLWHRDFARVYICRGYYTLSVFPTVPFPANSALSCDMVALLKLPHHPMGTGRVYTSLRDLGCYSGEIFNLSANAGSTGDVEDLKSLNQMQLSVQCRKGLLWLWNVRLRLHSQLILVCIWHPPFLPLSFISIPSLRHSSMNLLDVLMVPGSLVTLQPQISVYFYRKKEKIEERQH